MLRGEGDDILVRAGQGFADMRPLGLDAGEGLLAGLQHLPARLGELHRMVRPVDEGGADPRFKGLDATAERRLADIVHARGF